MIRQAILCDICGAEKKQTNNWFVAYTQEGELRVSGWSPQKLLHAGARHLCGQTCLHKLVDEFVARVQAKRLPVALAGGCEVKRLRADVDASLTSGSAYEESVPAARLIPAPAPVLPALPPAPVPVEMVTVPAEKPVAPPADSLDRPVLNDPSYGALRHRRAAAWERECARERESGAAAHSRFRAHS